MLKLKSLAEPESLMSRAHKTFTNEFLPKYSIIFTRAESFKIAKTKLLQKSDNAEPNQDFRPINLMNTNVKLFPMTVIEFKKTFANVVKKRQYLYIPGKQ